MAAVAEASAQGKIEIGDDGTLHLPAIVPLEQDDEPRRTRDLIYKARPEVITVSMRELDRLKTVQAVVDGQLGRRAAGEYRLAISVAARTVRAGRPAGTDIPPLGQPGHNQLPPGVEARARGLIRDSYADAGPTLAA